MRSQTTTYDSSGLTKGSAGRRGTPSLVGAAKLRELKRWPFLFCFCLSACVYDNYSGPLLPAGADPAGQAGLARAASSLDLAVPLEEALVPVRGPAVVSLPEPKLELTSEVERELTHFVKKDRRFIELALERKEKLLPHIEEIFEEEGVPHQLINVALIESGFIPEARSYAGAVGMWQFMKITARSYGLKVGLIEDQRKDPILSTKAAARHLRDLFLIYKDWNLALAAYNAGTGSLAKAINRAKDNDFWTLARTGHLPRETARFVPRFIASAMIVSNPERYGFEVPGDASATKWAERDLEKESSTKQFADRSGPRHTPLG